MEQKGKGKANSLFFSWDVHLLPSVTRAPASPPFELQDLQHQLPWFSGLQIETELYHLLPGFSSLQSRD